MSDYSNGRMSFDVMADAQSALISDLEATGEPYCDNCLRLERHCDCDNPKIMEYDEEVDGYKERK